MPEQPQRPKGAQINVCRISSFSIKLYGPPRYLTAMRPELERFGEVQYGLGHHSVQVNLFASWQINSIASYLAQYADWFIEDYDAKQPTPPPPTPRKRNWFDALFGIEEEN